MTDLFGGTGLTDVDAPLAVFGRLQGDGQPDPIANAGVPDAIDQAVGRSGYLAPHTEADCLVDDEPATFDRYYFPTGDGKAVYVDTVRDSLERGHDEAEKQVAAKRKWSKTQGLKYLVVVEDTVTV
jgi:hypothetical protein